MNFEKLKKQLELIKINHTEKGLDPVWICVRSLENWRIAKKIGCKKGYHGWVFYSTSTNSNGYSLYEKIQKACEGYNMSVTYKDL